MTRNAKVGFIALPVTIAVAAGITVAVVTVPRSIAVLPGLVGELLGPHFGREQVARQTVPPPTAVQTPGTATEPPDTPDAGTQEVAADPGADRQLIVEPAEPVEPAPEPIDYARLNHDVRLIADTLERFNQKLLRMIAQAKSAQVRQAKEKRASNDGSAPPAETGATTEPAEQELSQ